MPSAGKLPSGVGTEVVEGLLLLGRSRSEIRSSGIIGHTEVKNLRFDLAVSPVEIGNTFDQPAFLCQQLHVDAQ